MTRSRLPAACASSLLLACVFGPHASAQPAPSGGEFRGFLSVVQGDPAPGQPAGGVYFSLSYPDGTRVPVEVAPAIRNAAAGLAGKRVVVKGALAGDRAAPRIAAHAIEAAGEAPRRPAK